MKTYLADAKARVAALLPGSHLEYVSVRGLGSNGRLQSVASRMSPIRSWTIEFRDLETRQAVRFTYLSKTSAPNELQVTWESFAIEEAHPLRTADVVPDSDLVMQTYLKTRGCRPPEIFRVKVINYYFHKHKNLGDAIEIFASNFHALVRPDGTLEVIRDCEGRHLLSRSRSKR
jgi:hypothetical protein